MGKGKNEQSIIFTIKGTEEEFHIRKNTIYKVEGRFDDNAPSGLQTLGVSKIPFAGNGDKVMCRFDEGAGVFNTGFYPNSKCYSSLDRSEAEKLAKQAYNNIGKPFSDLTNNDISQFNNDFWDNYIVTLNDSTILFDTNNPSDLFRMYVAILSRKLVPEELEGDPHYGDAFYRLIDTTSASEFKNEYDLDLMKSTAAFVTLLGGDEESVQGAKDIAIYLGFYDGSDVSNEYLMLAFNHYLKEAAANIKSFNRVYTMYHDPVECEILKVCRMLAILTLRGKVSTTKQGISLKGKILGKDRKVIAEKAVINKTGEKDKMFIVDEYHALLDMQEDNDEES